MKKAGDWLESKNHRLDGFKWSGGTERVTTGILIWPEVFKYDHEDGRKIAIILIDTQGIFDNRTTMKDNTTIFALSTLLSSVQIFNVMQNISENDLHHLQLFSEYGRFAAEQGKSKPFQNLMFLVRDWQNPLDFAYGSVEGLKYVTKYFEKTDDQGDEQKSTRDHITSCYANIGCFLMPFPGISVSTNQNFNGNLESIEGDFKQQLRSLVPELLAPEKLVVKKIGGISLTCADFLEYFKQYLEIFCGDEIPKPKTLMEANAWAHNIGRLTKSKEYYAKVIEALDTTLKESDEKLNEDHNVAKKVACGLLENTLLGSPDMILKVKSDLENYITKEFQILLDKNSKKWSTENILTGTGAVAGTAVVVAAVASNTSVQPAPPPVVSTKGLEDLVTAMVASTAAVAVLALGKIMA